MSEPTPEEIAKIRDIIQTGSTPEGSLYRSLGDYLNGNRNERLQRAKNPKGEIK